ncbi:MAG: outer membrane protein transport protein [Ignavibacteriae bacterium]|nr:outer membrane protein transport protein [Ignavibacteriota bacterium]
MKKISKLTLSIIITIAISSNIFANGLSLNSLGSRALGMGGAFVALSNDATAIYWNPAGLADQKSSVLAYFTGVMPIGSYQYEFPLAGINIDTKTESKIYPTGGLLGVYNLGKISVGLGVYVPAGLGATWDGADLAAFSGTQAFEWESQIGVVSISPAVAYQVNDQFSVGLALNFNYAMFDLLRPDAADLNRDGVAETPVQYTEESTGLGISATLGLKYEICQQIAVGATFRTASSVAMDGTADIDSKTLGNIINTDFSREVTWPMWIGGGVAYKPTKCLTVALDAQYSNWGKLDKLVAEYDKMPEGEFLLDWADAIQIRLGGEYMVSPATAIRLGYYYDPAPAPDETLNILFPSSTNHVFTGGVGYSFGNYTVEAAAEYLYGADRDVEAYPNLLQAENMPGLHHLDVFAFSVGFSMGL